MSITGGRKAAEKAVREILADSYTPEGVELWLRKYRIDTFSPLELLDRGEWNKVIETAERLRQDGTKAETVEG